MHSTYVIMSCLIHLIMNQKKILNSIKKIVFFKPNLLKPYLIFFKFYSNDMDIQKILNSISSLNQIFFFLNDMVIFIY